MNAPWFAKYPEDYPAYEAERTALINIAGIFQDAALKAILEYQAIPGNSAATVNYSDLCAYLAETAEDCFPTESGQWLSGVMAEMVGGKSK